MSRLGHAGGSRGTLSAGARKGKWEDRTVAIYFSVFMGELVKTMTKTQLSLWERGLKEPETKKKSCKELPTKSHYSLLQIAEMGEQSCSHCDIYLILSRSLAVLGVTQVVGYHRQQQPWSSTLSVSSVGSTLSLLESTSPPGFLPLLFRLLFSGAVFLSLERMRLCGSEPIFSTAPNSRLPVCSPESQRHCQQLPWLMLNDWGASVQHPHH